MNLSDPFTLWTWRKKLKIKVVNFFRNKSRALRFYHLFFVNFFLVFLQVLKMMICMKSYGSCVQDLWWMFLILVTEFSTFLKVTWNKCVSFLWLFFLLLFHFCVLVCIQFLSKQNNFFCCTSISNFLVFWVVFLFVAAASIHWSGIESGNSTFQFTVEDFMPCRQYSVVGTVVWFLLLCLHYMSLCLFFVVKMIVLESWCFFFVCRLSKKLMRFMLVLLCFQNQMWDISHSLHI